MARKPNPFMTDEDNPSLSGEELAAAQPAATFLPADVLADLKANEPKRRPGQRGPGKHPPKVVVSLRLEQATLDAWKASGPSWQSRVNAVREKAAPKVKRAG